MRHTILILPLLLLGACSTGGTSGTESPAESRNTPVVDPELASYVEDFLVDCGYGPYWHQLTEVVVYPTRSHEEDQTVGWCETMPGSRWVAISPSLRGRPALLRLVVYHELGHCALGLGHSEDGKSIMAATQSAEDVAWMELNWRTAVTNLCGSK